VKKKRFDISRIFLYTIFVAAIFAVVLVVNLLDVTPPVPATDDIEVVSLDIAAATDILLAARGAELEKLAGTPVAGVSSKTGVTGHAGYEFNRIQNGLIDDIEFQMQYASGISESGGGSAEGLNAVLDEADQLWWDKVEEETAVAEDILTRLAESVHDEYLRQRVYDQLWITVGRDVLFYREDDPELLVHSQKKDLYLQEKTNLRNEIAALRNTANEELKSYLGISPNSNNNRYSTAYDRYQLTREVAVLDQLESYGSINESYMAELDAIIQDYLHELETTDGASGFNESELGLIREIADRIRNIHSSSVGSIQAPEISPYGAGDNSWVEIEESRLELFKND
jgi:hypothetical protein